MFIVVVVFSTIFVLWVSSVFVVVFFDLFLHYRWYGMFLVCFDFFSFVSFCYVSRTMFFHWICAIIYMFFVFVPFSLLFLIFVDALLSFFFIFSCYVSLSFFFLLFFFPFSFSFFPRAFIGFHCFSSLVTSLIPSLPYRPPLSIPLPNTLRVPISYDLMGNL